MKSIVHNGRCEGHGDTLWGACRLLSRSQSCEHASTGLVKCPGCSLFTILRKLLVASVDTCVHITYAVQLQGLWYTAVSMPLLNAEIVNLCRGVITA